MIEHEGLILGRLGSRFSLRFDPQARYLYSSPLGIGFDRPLRLEISVVAGGKRVVWPFSPGQPFDSCRGTATMSSLEFLCTCMPLGIELMIRFTSPFYPLDEKTSCAPFFYLDLACRQLPKEERTITELKVALFAREGETVSREGTDIILRGTYQFSEQGPHAQADDFSRRNIPGAIGLVPLRGRMSLKETTFTIASRPGEEENRATFILAAYCEEPALNVAGDPQRLRYVQWFPSISAVAAFAKSNEGRIRRKVGFFDDIFLRSSLSSSDKHFIAGEFQSFLSRTWWTHGEGAPDWFGGWDECGIHNTIESEYAASLFYLNLWPDLLERQLVQRADWAGKSGIFPSSCGRFLTIEPSSARAANTGELSNYLLMLFSHWRWWNRFRPIEKHLPLVKDLTSSLLSSLEAQPLFLDKKTFDSGEFLKLLCALDAAAIIADEAGDAEPAESLSQMMREIERLLATGPPPRGNADGLLHHVICDNLPQLDPAVIRKFFSSPSTADSLNGAPAAQHNLSHDITAAYFGFNFLQSQHDRDGGFNQNGNSTLNVSFTGAGATAIGIIQALMGVKLDRVEQTLSISPLCVPAYLPLLPLVDWENRRVPWVEIWSEGLTVRADIAGAGQIKEKLDFAVDPHRELRCRRD
jgi:hypothetical protein